MAAPSPARSFLGTMSLVSLAIGAIFSIDMFLAKTERAESRVAAAQLFRQGRDFMQSGRNAEAVERLKGALAIERGNRDYLRALAQAQLAAGDATDAESTLTDCLQSDSTDGLANLIMARVLVKEGRFAEAISYFHRAVYGHWYENAADNQLRARFELIDLLEQRNSKEELLAELLPVQDHAPPDVKTRMRLGQLFLAAGAPARAADVFHEILRDAPSSADAYAGLGEAEFDRGNYRVAQRDFQAALRVAPGQQAARQGLDRCDELLKLDPTQRGLGPAERLSRSLKLIELTQNQASQCAGQNPPPELQQLFDHATLALKAHVSTARQSEAAESNLDLAEQLWQAGKRECKSPPPADSPLALVLARISQ